MPVPFSAWALASPPTRGRSWASGHRSLDKLYRNLHKPQCSRCRGRLRKLAFPLVSLWLLWLAIPRTGSWRNLGGNTLPTSRVPHPCRVQLIRKSSGLHAKLLPQLVGDGGWRGREVVLIKRKWAALTPENCNAPIPAPRSRAGISWLCFSIVASFISTPHWTSQKRTTKSIHSLNKY